MYSFTRVTNRTVTSQWGGLQPTPILLTFFNVLSSTPNSPLLNPDAATPLAQTHLRGGKTKKVPV